MAKITSLCDESEGFPLTILYIENISNRIRLFCFEVSWQKQYFSSHNALCFYALSVRMSGAYNTCQRIEVVIRYRLFVNLPQRQDKSPPLPSRLNGEQETWHRRMKKKRVRISGSTVRHIESFLSSPHCFFCLSGWSILASEHQTDALNLLFRKMGNFNIWRDLKWVHLHSLTHACVQIAC